MFQRINILLLVADGVIVTENPVTSTKAVSAGELVENVSVFTV